MESGLQEALLALKNQDYTRAEHVLSGLLTLEEEENNGL
jgi:hypothetical protein